MIDETTERILIVYSTHKTSSDDIDTCKQAVSSFVQRTAADGNVHPVKCVAYTFRVPPSTGPSATLSSELGIELRRSAGAIVFIDDLRPNVAYELGYFHGRGLGVLLLTREDVQQTWVAISDLAGCPLVDLRRTPTKQAVTEYLNRQYETLSKVQPWIQIPFPRGENNLLRSLYHGVKGVQWRESEDRLTPRLVLRSWEPVDSPLNHRLCDQSKFLLSVRRSSMVGHFFVWFGLQYIDREGIRRRTWLGLSTYHARSHIKPDERIIPCERIGPDWGIIGARFMDILERAMIFGVERLEYLDVLRFRVGETPDVRTSGIRGAILRTRELTPAQVLRLLLGPISDPDRR